MSFLKSQGHVSASFYPLNLLWTEARIARNRLNREICTNAIAIQRAIASNLDKDGAKLFSELIKGLSDGG